MYRGDLARDGHPAEATLTVAAAKHLKAVWQVETSGAINGTPAVAGGMVVAASAGGVVAAYRLGTGATLWQLNGLGAISSSPTIAAAHVIVGTLTGHIIAIGLDGTLLWDSVAPGIKPAIWSSPTVYGQLVLAGVGSQYGDSPLETGRIIALDLATGARVWSVCALACKPGDGIWSTPAIDGAGRGFIGVGNPDDGVLAFEVATGKPLWFMSLHPDAGRDVDVGATPIVLQSGGREAIAVGSNAGIFKLLDAASGRCSGRVTWSRAAPCTGCSPHPRMTAPTFTSPRRACLSACSRWQPRTARRFGPTTAAFRFTPRRRSAKAL